MLRCYGNATDLLRNFYGYVAGLIVYTYIIPYNNKGSLQGRKKSIQMKSWLQRRLYYGHLDSMRSWWQNSEEETQRPSEIRYIVSQSPCVKQRPVRTEPSIYKCRRCWSRDSENESYTPWHNRAVSVAYPLHIRSLSVVNREAGAQFLLRQIPERIRICYGCVTTVASRLSTDT